MSLKKVLVIKGNIPDNAESVGNNTEFISITPLYNFSIKKMSYRTF